MWPGIPKIPSSDDVVSLSPESFANVLRFDLVRLENCKRVAIVLEEGVSVIKCNGTYGLLS
jgi:hypothetical protein